MTGPLIANSRDIAIENKLLCYLQCMATARRKTSFELDFEKVDAVRGVLGTRSLTDTVDAALDEVIRLRERAQLVEILFKPGALELDDPTAMAGAWR
jgi:hypothetical protein